MQAVLGLGVCGLLMLAYWVGRGKGLVFGILNESGSGMVRRRGVPKCSRLNVSE
jgi:hypothetical protein